MPWALLPPATANIRHQCALDLSVGQNHLEATSNTSTESPQDLRSHNGTQETVLEFSMAMVLLAWGTRLHLQPGRASSPLEEGEGGIGKLTELQLPLLILDIPTTIFYQIKCRGSS